MGCRHLSREHLHWRQLSPMSMQHYNDHNCRPHATGSSLKEQIDYYSNEPQCNAFTTDLLCVCVCQSKLTSKIRCIRSHALVQQLFNAILIPFDCGHMHCRFATFIAVPRPSWSMIAATTAARTSTATRTAWTQFCVRQKYALKPHYSHHTIHLFANNFLLYIWYIQRTSLIWWRCHLHQQCHLLSLRHRSVRCTRAARTTRTTLIYSGSWCWRHLLWHSNSLRIYFVYTSCYFHQLETEFLSQTKSKKPKKL